MLLFANLIKFLFFVLIFFVFFSIARFIFFFARSFRGGMKSFHNIDQKNNANIKKNSAEDKRTTIELDKDQYKVE